MKTKSALVTGASEGIGKAFAVELAARGYQVTGVARNEQALKGLVQQLGAKHSYIVADLATESGQELIQQKLRESSFDLLVNNAGVGTVGKFTSVSCDKQIAMLNLNNMALVKLCYAYLEKAKVGDCLINVSSVLAFVPTPSMALYSASKAFVSSFSEALWYEYQPQGIYIQGLCPGITETNFQVAAGGKKADLPKNLSQTPEHVAKVSLAEMDYRRKPTVFTGTKNMVFAGMSRILSRKAVVKMSGAMMHKK